MATSVVFPRAQFFANNGKPLIGGRIHTYVAGSSTRAVTYKDAAKTQPNTNPILLDGRGEAAIYLTEGVEYKFVLEDASGALILTQEPVYGAVWPNAESWPSDATLSYKYMTEAKAVADATSPVKFYDTLAQAQADAGNLHNGDIVEITSDSEYEGARTRRKFLAGALTFVANLDQVRLDLASQAEGMGSELVSGVAQLVQSGAALRQYRGKKVNAQITQRGVGGDFYVDPDDVASADNNGTVFVGDDGRRWKRHFDGALKGEWFGISAAKTDNTAEISAAVNAAPFSTVLLPAGTIKCNLSVINIPSFSTIEGVQGKTILTGPDAKTTNIADGQGYMLRAYRASFVTIRNLHIANGYKGRGISIEGCADVLIEDVTTDGFTYSMWVAEDEWGGKGSRRVKIVRPRVLNPRYWGIYVRGYEITVDADKTQDILIQDPYCYGASMAAIVLSEGNVRNAKIIRPTAETCNVHMHIEGASNYVIEHPVDNDIGKKSWMVPANSEYPFTGWSLYHIFAEGGHVIGGKLAAACYHSASAGPIGHHGHQMRCVDLLYEGTRADTWIFEGVGDIQDVQLNAFENITLRDCIAQRAMVYQQPSDSANSFIRNLKVIGGECRLGILGPSGSGKYVAVNIVRGHSVQVDDATIRNACLRIRAYGLNSVRNNKFLGGTDQTRSEFDGIDGRFDKGNYLDFTGNKFEYAGGGVIGDSAILCKNFSAVRVDNKLNGNSKVNYLYRFQDNFRIEYAHGFGIGELVAKFVESGTTDFRQAYAPTTP